MTYSLLFSSTQEGWSCGVLIWLCCLSERDCDWIQVEYWIVSTVHSTYPCMWKSTYNFFVLSVSSPTKTTAKKKPKQRNKKKNPKQTKKTPKNCHTPFSRKQTPLKDTKMTFDYYIISVSGKFLPGNGHFSVTNELTPCSSWRFGSWNSENVYSVFWEKAV